jgi:hypothetical protein
MDRESAYRRGLKKFINKKLTYSYIDMQYKGVWGGVIIIIHIFAIYKWVVRNA